MLRRKKLGSPDLYRSDMNVSFSIFLFGKKSTILYISRPALQFYRKKSNIVYIYRPAFQFYRKKI